MSSRKSTTELSDEADKIITDLSEVALQEARNGLLQFDEVLRLAEQFASAQQFTATPELIAELNRIAIQGIRHSAGCFRLVPIGISNTRHVPPPPEEVEQLVAEMCDYVNRSWRKTGDDIADAIHISAYFMWRLNWIHPFRDGNGRTSRAMSYLALCTRLGQLVPGTPTIADQIVDNREPYYEAFDAADDAWRSGTVDLTAMESLLQTLLMRQLDSI